MKKIGCFFWAFIFCDFLSASEYSLFSDDQEVIGLDLRGASFAQLSKKIQREEEIRMAMMGGSITQNPKGHSSLIPEWFRMQFPQNSLRTFNLGLSSTCSITGAFRMQKHLLSREPIDLLLVEFAVNDNQDAHLSFEAAIRGMEGIVRRAHSEEIPVLMILFPNQELLARVQAGVSAPSLQAHLAVADNYMVPTVNVVEALADAIERDQMTWEDYGGVHPSADGYAFATNLVVTAMSRLLNQKTDSPLPDLPEPLDPHCYSRAFWTNPSAATFAGTWYHGHPVRKLIATGNLRKEYFAYPLARSITPGSSLRFKFEGNSVSGFFLAGPDAGVIEVKIDEGETREIDLYHVPYSRRLNYPRSLILADGLVSGSHILELSVSKKNNPASIGNACNILYFGVNQ